MRAPRNSPIRPLRVASTAVLALAATALVSPAHAAPAAPSRPAITGIAHIALAAQNMDADRAFYTHTLGWNAVSSPEFADGVRFYGDARQSVEVHPAKSASELALEHVAFATADANALRLYLKSKGIAVPNNLTVLRDGARTFRVKDPEGNTIEFVQRAAGGDTPAGKAPDSISGRIIHAGLIVHSAASEDRFYKDILGFHSYWSGGMKEGTTDWVSLQVPDGTDWIEYMLNAPPTPSRRQIGVDDHFSLGVLDMDTVVAKLGERGWKPNEGSKKQMGRDGKVQLNLYDPDEVRVEFMEFKPRQQPCCNPITGAQPGPDK